MQKFIPALVIVASAFAQTKVDLGNQGQNVNFSSFPYTFPVSVVSSLPATCSVGQLTFLTTATVGKNFYGCTSTNTWTVMSGSSSGSGTVTSVGLSLPSIFNLTGSPITTAGTFNETLATQTANQFFAAPNGVAGTPLFRSILAADVPTLNQSTTGNAATATALASAPTNCSTGYAPTGIAANGNAQNCTSIGSGGSGVTSVGLALPTSTFTISGSPVTGTGTLTAAFVSQSINTFLAGPSSGSSGVPTFRTIAVADVPTLNQNTTGTAAALTATPTLCPTGQAPVGILANGNATGCAAIGGGSFPGTTNGDTYYYNGSTTVRLAGPTAAQTYALTETGTGSAPAAPSWLAQYALSTGCGTTSSVSGGNVSVNVVSPTRNVTGTTDTITYSTDCNGLVTYTNASGVSISLPQPGVTGIWTAGQKVTVKSYSAALAVNPSSSSIGTGSSGASYTVPANAACDFVSDGMNWQLGQNCFNGSLLSVSASLPVTATTTGGSVSVGWYNSVKNPAYGGGATGNGTTNDQTAVAAAITAICVTAGGGVVYFPAGTYLVSGLTMYSNCVFKGDGVGNTVIQLAAGANADVIKSSTAGYSGGVITNYVAASASGAQSGISKWGLEDLTVDGNNGNQTSTSVGVHTYGFYFRISNVDIRNTYGDCFAQDYNPSGGDLYFPVGAEEPYVENLKTYHCGMNSANTTVLSVGAVGIRWSGPFDAQWKNVISYQNASHGIMIGPNGGATQITNLHAWGSHIGNNSANMIVEAGSVSCSNCEVEGSDTAQLVLLSGSSHHFGVTVFQPTNEANASYGVQMGQVAGVLPFAGVYHQTTPGNLTPGSTDSIASGPLYSRVTGTINNCYNAGLYLANESNNTYELNIYQTSGNYVSASSAQSGLPQPNDNYNIQGAGLTCPTSSGATLGLCGGAHVTSNASRAFSIGNGSLDYLNYSGLLKELQINQGGGLQLYSDTSTTKTYRLDSTGGLEYNSGSGTLTFGYGAPNAWKPNGGWVWVYPSSTAQTLTNGATILNSGITGAGNTGTYESINVTESATVTGILLQSGQTDGQQISIINWANYSIQFASSTKLLSGAGLTIGPYASIQFRWSATNSSWYAQSVNGQTVSFTQTSPVLLYSAAGTALPTCAVGLKGNEAVVSDATTPTYMGAYTSGGAITTKVICSYNGTTYSWLTH